MHYGTRGECERRVGAESKANVRCAYAGAKSGCLGMNATEVAGIPYRKMPSKRFSVQKWRILLQFQIFWKDSHVH